METRFDMAESYIFKPIENGSKLEIRLIDHSGNTMYMDLPKSHIYDLIKWLNLYLVKSNL